MRLVLAIDPGTTHSAYCLYDTSTSEILDAAKVDNCVLLDRMRKSEFACDILVIEMIASYGMAVGKSTFETCVWIGRFIEAISGDAGHQKMYRSEVKMAVCGSPRAKDKNIRRALIDRFPATGGGKEPAIGTIAKPGPLYGFSTDMWAALGVAVTYQDQQRGVA